MKPITIIGGGVAGLSLGLGLRQRSIPVRVLEAGEYPRHRVCGEFLSGSGVETLDRLGLLRSLESGDAVAGRSVAFFDGGRCLGTRALPTQALCISRHVLDSALADAFRAAGGELVCGSRWTAGALGEGMVRATGRRPVGTQSGWRWVGLKGQAEDVSLMADLEMYFLPDGYVGICRLPGGKVNVCGLFRRSSGAASTAAGVLEPLRGPEGGPLWRKLEKARWNGSSACAVAGLGIARQSIADEDECCVGDAQGLIPPVTGNGMSLALESAGLAADPAAAYARGECDWNTVVKTVAARCDHAFHRRLTWSRWMHRALFVPAFRAGLAGLILHVGPAWRWAFSVTR